MGYTEHWEHSMSLGEGDIPLGAGTPSPRGKELWVQWEGHREMGAVGVSPPASRAKRCCTPHMEAAGDASWGNQSSVCGNPLHPLPEHCQSTTTVWDAS